MKKLNYSFFAVGAIVSALESAYVAGWKALKIARKLKQGKRHKSRIMGNLNRIRSELHNFKKAAWPLFDNVKYSGIVLDLLTRRIIHSRFLRAAI